MSFALVLALIDRLRLFRIVLSILVLQNRLLGALHDLPSGHGLLIIIKLRSPP